MNRLLKSLLKTGLILLEEPELFAIVRGFLEGAAKARGLSPARA